MKYPKDNTSQNIKDFLLFSIENNSIENWNNWKKETKNKLEYIKLDNLNLVKHNLNNIDFSNLIIINSSFSNSNLKNINFFDCMIINTNFKNTHIKDCDFYMSTVKNCQYTSSNIRSCNFIMTKISNCDFSATNIDMLDFEDARLDNVDFSNSRLKDTTFFHADIDNVYFTDAVQINIDYRGTILDDSMGDFIIDETIDIEQKLFETEKKLKDISTQSEKEKIELEKKYNKLQQELARLSREKQKETDNIEKIIKFLAAMPKEISDEQNYLKDRRKRFTLFGGLFLSLGGLTAVALIINILTDNKLCLPSITNTPQYFAYALAIGFPMAMAFLFYRQANVKSKEIEKINEKSILVQQVENALNSYNVLLSGNELKNKTISSIDRVINKIFDNNHKEEKSEKSEESKLTISDVPTLIQTGDVKDSQLK